MKVLPQNGYLYVEFVNRGTRTTDAGLEVESPKPEHTEVVSLKILAVDAEEKLFKPELARADVMAVLEEDE